MTIPPLSNYRILAALLDALAKWADDQIVSGVSPKWVSYQTIEMSRYIASLARIADTGYSLNDDPEGYMPDIR